MPVFYEAPTREPRGYRTLRDAVDGFKRISAERLAREQAQAQQASEPTFAPDDVDETAPYDSPEWLARNAMPRPPEPPPMEFVPPQPVTAEDLEASIRERDPTVARPFQPQPIPRSYFEPPQPSPLERAGNHVGESVDAFGRAAANAILPDMGDRFAAGMGHLTGIGGFRGDYRGNLRRENARSELAALNSPDANRFGEIAGVTMQNLAEVRLGALGALAKRRFLPPTSVSYSAPTHTYPRYRAPPR